MSEPNGVISTVFVRPKRDPKQFRVIFNLKALNQFVAYHKFKMETVEYAIKLTSKCCYMFSIDLRDAYYSIPIASKFTEKSTLSLFGGGRCSSSLHCLWASPAAPEFLLRFLSQFLLALDANLDIHVWAT